MANTKTTAQKMKFSVKDFSSKSFLRIWSHLLKKSLMENFIFCAVNQSLFLTNKNFFDVIGLQYLRND